MNLLDEKIFSGKTFQDSSVNWMERYFVDNGNEFGILPASSLNLEAGQNQIR